jgi:hypothetical protein
MYIYFFDSALKSFATKVETEHPPQREVSMTNANIFQCIECEEVYFEEDEWVEVYTKNDKMLMYTINTGNIYSISQKPLDY